MTLLAGAVVNADVGRTRGAFEVSAAGSAGYSVPLWTPTGLGALTPRLALSYSSRVGNGPFGVGWSLSGTSAITRCARTMAQDTTLGPLTLTTSDPLCLDGNRLRSTAVNTYQTELETYSRIKAFGTAGNGPAYFVVEGKDGLIYEYGNTTDSRIEAGGGAVATVRTWALNKIRDRVGNSIQFVYQKDTTNKTYRLTDIYYPYTVGGAGPYYRVQLVYETRPAADTQSYYVTGYQAVDTQRVDRIDVFHSNAGWQLVRRYDLSYAAATATSRSRLTQLQECGPTACLSPSVFGYQDGTAGLAAETSAGQTPSIASNATTYTIDMNGDGHDDFVYPSAATSTWWVALGTNTGFAAATNTTVSSLNYAKALPVDFDSDGRMDLLVPNASNQWRILKSTGTSFTATDLGIAATGAGGDATTADYNGDGRPDLIWAQVSQIKGRLNTGTGFSTTITTLYTLPGTYESFSQQGKTAFGTPGFIFRTDLRVADFDGDGRQDLFARYAFDNNEGIAPPNYSFHWRVLLSRTSSLVEAATILDWNQEIYEPLLADVNGDGFTDVLYATGGTWKVMLANGLSGFTTVSTTAAIGTHIDSRVMDWDGDGRSDLITRQGTTYYVSRWNGLNFETAVSTGVVECGVACSNMNAIKVADVNGDGQRDWVFTNVSTGALAFRLHAGSMPDLATSLADGFGVAASPAYVPIAQSAHTKSTGAAFPDQDWQGPMYVVWSVALTDGTGTGSTYQKTYAYTGARWHLQGRGFLGFASRTEIDGSASYNVRRIESFRQTFPYIGQLASRELQQSAGTRISYAALTWSALTWGTGDTARSFPYVSNASLDVHELGGVYNGTKVATSTTSVAAIDTTSGLVTDKTATVTEVATGLFAASSRSERTWHSSVLNDTTNWCLGRPQATSVIASHTQAQGASITRTADGTWDGVYCRLTQRRDEPGSGTLQVTEGLSYDTFGNLATRTVTGIGMSPRTTTVGYGTRGQSPETITRQVDATFSEVSSQTWNYALTVPATATDPNSLPTTWHYDEFGRPTLETRADGTRTAWSRTSCTSCGSRVTYYLQADEQNTSGVTFRSARVYLDRLEQVAFQYVQLPGGAWAYRADTVRDARGRPTTIHEPYVASLYNGYRTLTYDATDRPTAIALYTSAGAFDRQQTIGYEGLSDVVTDPRSNVTRRYRSAWGTLLRVSDAAGGSTNHQYDAFGNQKQVTDAYGNVSVSASYNLRGMRTQMADMNLGTWTFTPNALGETISQLDAKGQTTSFSFDRLGRLTGRTEAEGSSAWTWGQSSAAKNVGRIASVTGPGYSEAFSYNTVGQLVTRTITSDATYAIDLAYNDIGALHTLTYPTSTAGVRVKVKYGYSNGYVASVRDFTGGVDGTVYWSQTAVDPRGNTIDESFGNGLRVVTGFNPLTGLIDYRQSGTGGSLTNVQNLSYGWDKAGNLTSRADVNRSLTETAIYDALNRLDYTQLNGTTNVDLTYDLIGNITWKLGIGNYTYDAVRKHAVTAAGTDTYGYDANGNVTSLNGTAGTVTWSSYNLPTSISGPSNAGPTSNQFSYGPDRERWRQILTYAGVTETTIYVGNLLEKITKSGVTTFKHYVTGFEGGGVIVTRRSDGVNSVLYLTRDHLGSVDSVTNASGAVQVRLSYDANGRRRNEATWSGNVPTADSIAIDATTDRAYTGHEYLDNINFVHMNGRVYMPRVSRFMSPDPIADGVGQPGGFNRYAYVQNNPLTATDPSGFLRTDPCTDCDVVRGPREARLLFNELQLAWGRSAVSLPKVSDVAILSAGMLSGADRRAGRGDRPLASPIETEKADEAIAELDRSLIDGRTEDNRADIVNVAQRVIAIDNPNWELAGVHWIRGIISTDIRYSKHIRPRHASDAKYPDKPLNGRFRKDLLSLATSKERFDDALSALFNSTAPMYAGATRAGILLEFVLPAPVGLDRNNNPTNEWSVIIAPVGNGVYEIVTTFPGLPEL